MFPAGEAGGLEQAGVRVKKSGRVVKGSKQILDIILKVMLLLKIRQAFG